MKTARGIIHVHSTYSHDGRHTLEEIAGDARMRGYRFVGMSEHSDSLSEEKMTEYVAACKRVSTPECVLIPGIEFTCNDNLHLVGLGVEHYTDKTDPVEVAAFIHHQNGVAIIAHPVRYNYRVPALVAGVVDGLEVWSAGYDGRFVPNDRSLRLVRELKQHRSSLLALCGEDLHRLRKHRHVVLTVAVHEVSSPGVLNALKARNATMSNSWFLLHSMTGPGRLTLLAITAARRFYLLAKEIRDLREQNSSATSTSQEKTP